MSTYCHRDVLYFDQLVGQIINNSIRKCHNKTIISEALECYFADNKLFTGEHNALSTNELILFYSIIIITYVHMLQYICLPVFNTLEYNMNGFASTLNLNMYCKVLRIKRDKIFIVNL